MVRGLDQFKEHFAEFTDQYVLIGGAACTLAMEEAGLDFRATKDLDIVLCIEALDKEFGTAFWQFIKAGGYQNQQRSSGKKLFYRFYGPRHEGYPEMCANIEMMLSVCFNYYHRVSVLSSNKP